MGSNEPQRDLGIQLIVMSNRDNNGVWPEQGSNVNAARSLKQCLDMMKNAITVYCVLYRAGGWVVVLVFVLGFFSFL